MADGLVASGLRRGPCGRQVTRLSLATCASFLKNILLGKEKRGEGGIRHKKRLGRQKREGGPEQARVELLQEGAIKLFMESLYLGHLHLVEIANEA